MSKRFYLEQKNLISNKPTILIGASEKTSYLIQSAKKGEIEYNPIAIFATDETHQEFSNSYISNIKVYSLANIDDFLSKNSVSSAIFTENIEHKKLNLLFEKLKKYKIDEIKTFPSLTDKDIKNISIEDLLARKPKDLDKKQIEQFIKDKTVLITGAGGSIGSELVKQVLYFNAKEIILLDHSEFNLYSIDDELKSLIKKLNKNIKTVNYLFSIVDRSRLKEVFEQHKIDLVLHSAAYKHVPLCEENIQSAIKNNIIGSKNIIELSIQFSIPKVVVISTDKAVRPTNIMGTTKRIVELFLQNIDSKNTELVAVRFGNVLNSSGSVIPKFKKQLENNQPITVTHPDITRYFMMISEACQLVLQAGSIAKGGEIFILDMGDPVKIVDLANKLRQLYQKEHIPIEFIGLRTGEKKYEELLLSEAEIKTKYKSIFVTSPTKYNIVQLSNDINELLNSKSDSKKIDILKKIVPEFQHKVNN
jgi:UDP-N-acetyl-D-glucosamine 4,6-dehydratase